jgi:6-phosphogluconolactonase
MVACDPVEEFVFVADLGTDTVYVYSIDLSSGQLTERTRLAFASGAGPRHVAFQPDWLTAYVLNELDSTLVVCEWNPAEPSLQPLQTVSSRAPGATGENLPAEVLVSGDGRYVNCSNRGDDTISVYATAQEGREVTQIQVVPTGGHWPRHLAFSPDETMLYAANERSDTIASFAVSEGTLTPAVPALSWPKPVCVLPF